MHGRFTPPRRRALATATLCSLVALSAMASGCAKDRAASGNARVAVAASALAAGVAEVLVTVKPGDGPSFSPITASLGEGPDGWSAFITGIPAGPGRAFEVVANDASHTTLQSGSAQSDVVAGETAIVIVTLLDVIPSDPLANRAPVIDYLSASQGSVRPGGTVRLRLSAHDPDPLDTWSLEWTATCGTFDGAPPVTRTVMTWTAPATPGRCQITARVSDDRGASVSAYLAVDVVLDSGDVLVLVNGVVNASPVVTGVTADVRYRAPVEGDLAVVAVDPDGDALAYAWSSSCSALSFGSPASSATTFSNPDGSTTCVVTVTVRDGKGGAVIGSVTLPPRAEFNIAPVITHTVQPFVDLGDPLRAEPISPGEAVVLAAEAYDPEGQALAFEWITTAGALDGQIDVRTSPGRTLIVFHAPAVVPSGLVVTVSVTDPQGEATRHDFLFKPASATDPCAGQPDGTACDDRNPCTRTDACQGGTCSGSNPVVCAAPATCKAPGVCQTTGASAGACLYADAPTGTACDDGRACTTADVCASGVCMSGASTCAGGGVCSPAGVCVCTPSCAGRVCGPDGCGGTCGPGCSPGAETCNDATGLCVPVCTPSCAGRVCGPDGCGGSCGTGCGATESCSASGQCVAATTRVVPKVAHALRVTPPAGVAVDASGNAFVAASISELTDVDFQTRPGGAPYLLRSQGGVDAFVARYDAAGDITWGVTVQDDNPAAITDQYASLVTITGNDRVGVVGKFSGTVTFGATTAGGANPTPYLAAFSSADGSRLWVRSYDLGPNGLFQAIAANLRDSSGRIVVCGLADASGSGRALDLVVAAYGPDGTRLWANQLGGSGNETCSGVAVDDGGDVVATGQFDGAALDFPGAGGVTAYSLTGPNTTARKYMWVARFSGATGATTQAVAYSGALGNAVPRAIAIRPGGDVVVAGSFSGQLSIGANMTSAGSEDVFVVELLGSSLAPAWNAIRFGGTGADLVRGVRATASGDVVVIGSFAASSATFRSANGGMDTSGAVGLLSSGGADIFVAKLDGATGAIQNAATYGATGTQNGDGIAVNGANQVVFSTTFGGTLGFGGLSITAAGIQDAGIVFAGLE